MVSSTKVDCRRAQRKLQKAKMKIIKAGNATIKDMVDIGKAHAKDIAPYDTGKTAKLIMGKVEQSSNGPKGIIIARNPTANDGHDRKMSGFNLVRWMHTSGKAQEHIKSGDRKFMYSTGAWLRRKKITVAKGHFDRIKIR